MANPLVEKLRNGRQFQHAVDGHKFTLQRPTEGEMSRMHDFATVTFLERFVVGWDFTEIDLGIPGGTSVAVPFDPMVWAEYIGDHKELWTPLGKPLLDAIDAYKEKTKAEAKN